MLRRRPAHRSSDRGRRRFRADRTSGGRAGGDAASATGRALPDLRDTGGRSRAGGGARNTFGPRLHAVATYLKTFQALSYARSQAALSNLFRLTLSQGRLMNLLQRAQKRFRSGRNEAVSTLRRATVVASDETGGCIEGSNAYHWVFHSIDAVVHTASPTRGAIVVREMMDGHRPAWYGSRTVTPPSRVMPPNTRPASPISPATSPTSSRQATIRVPWRLQLWLQSVFALAERVTDLATSTLAAKTPEPGSATGRHPRYAELLRPDLSPLGQDRAGSRSAPDLPRLSRRGRTDQQRFREAAAPIRYSAKGHQRLPRDLGR